MVADDITYKRSSIVPHSCCTTVQVIENTSFRVIKLHCLLPVIKLLVACSCEFALMPRTRCCANHLALRTNLKNKSQPQHSYDNGCYIKEKELNSHSLNSSSFLGRFASWMWVFLRSISCDLSYMVEYFTKPMRTSDFCGPDNRS